MNRHTGLTINDESEHIKQSIADILLTAKGSRVMRRTYGSNLYQLIDRPISSALLLQISAACVMALKMWEPRIDVTAFKVEIADLNRPHSLTGTIDATVKNGNTKLTMTDLTLR
ncbi:GPW/gp25 family protein [Glaesserella parasuis]|uniref:Baseplate wedge subunit n=1 Tax=Glaesserella parasuis TaxID=738 RepID=A0A859IG59_GLAPU|nr:GPW/gp25 family protein [Glaesserella parasuis]EQA14239.1 lysozyme family protein [Glaesserella parasuis H465]MDG6264252.1 GPW/gp25 family protein [Glaesserella parasuis]MDG6327838.1 GPW/gp25 family protein [Glaesserella parasuis]MDG6357940.1 GPW/gp25 family protein [Glaesserella parasuis]MDO9700124.1 GPW/gp25 family protein [Glaesserella parasuis]